MTKNSESNEGPKTIVALLEQEVASLRKMNAKMESLMQKEAKRAIKATDEKQKAEQKLQTMKDLLGFSKIEDFEKMAEEVCEKICDIEGKLDELNDDYDDLDYRLGELTQTDWVDEDGLNDAIETIEKDFRLEVEDLDQSDRMKVIEDSFVDVGKSISRITGWIAWFEVANPFTRLLGRKK